MALNYCGTELTRQESESPVSLAVCGDPIAGRALVLLLNGYGYSVRFVPASSLGDPESLEGVRLLLLMLTADLHPDRGEDALRSIEAAVASSGIPTLKLLSSEEVWDAELSEGTERVMFWPCSTELLRQHIQAALCEGRSPDHGEPPEHENGV